MKTTYTINRVSPTCCQVDNHLGLDVKLFANETVGIEQDAFDELFEFLDVHRAAQDITVAQPDFFGLDAKVNRVVLTPDFHKGSGVPVGTVVDVSGFVIPKAIGNDICCGMRLLTTDLPFEKLEPYWDEIQKSLRSIFFQGKRDIPMSPRQREAVLRSGLPGLLEAIDDNANNGIYRDYYDKVAQRSDLDSIHSNGGFLTKGIFGFDKFIQSSGNIDGRDPQIGSVGGSNHFCEIQRIDDIYCGESARKLDVVRGNVAIMVHSGSVGLGHAVGGHFIDRAKEIYPKDVIHPKNDFYMLPMQGQHEKEGAFYIDSMHNAANFAFANRLFIGMMATRAIKEATGLGFSTKLVYDAPHNLVFSGSSQLHRKGATPAEGPSTDSEWMGKPVLIPGSMGSSSYLLTGHGNVDALSSACHGAGRALSRGAAAHVSNEQFDKETEHLRIVNPIDIHSPQMQMRKDIVEKLMARRKEEAPYAYKPITPVIESVVGSDIARLVAKLMPLCTVKGW